MKIDFSAIIPKFDAILERGLCAGVGERDGQMCIEAAICAALDLPHGDKPSCVAYAVREYKISINDRKWSSPQARAAGLRDIGIAQIGSKGIVNDMEFTERLAEKTIRVLIPALFRERFPDNAMCLAAADRCEKEGTTEVAREAYAAAYAAADAAADAAVYAAGAYAAASAADAAAAYAAYGAAASAAAAAYAAYGAAASAAAAAVSSRSGDKYLLLSASLALEVLRELKSPGCEWLDWRES